MNTSGRTDRDALAAQTALHIIYVRNIVSYPYRFKGTLFLAFPATDTRIAARFTCNTTLIFIDARNKYTP
jgi:hypothetical protein